MRHDAEDDDRRRDHDANHANDPLDEARRSTKADERDARGERDDGQSNREIKQIGIPNERTAYEK